jgi:hypothetical protein
VLENLVILHNSNLLEKRANLLRSGKYKGNTKELKAYKQELPALTKEQIEYCVGLLLGDATLQSNTNLTSFRLKIQQSENNNSLLFAIERIFQPWVMSGPSKPKTRKIGNKYQELQTISHEAFCPLATMFQDSNIELKYLQCVTKVIPADIGDYLTPLAVATWFCGDGGRRDYGVNEGKAIQFHTQGFSKECCEKLTQALKDRYQWDVTTKFDYVDENKRERYLIQVEASSFESFMEQIPAYILPHFLKRLPSQRKR